MTLTQKVTRAASTAEEFLQSDHKSVANNEEVEEYDETSDSKKHKKNIAYWIGRTCKPPSSNNDKEAEVKE